MSKYFPIFLAKLYVESSLYSEDGINFSESVFDSTVNILALLEQELKVDKKTWENNLMSGIIMQTAKKMLPDIYKCVSAYCLAFSSNGRRAETVDVMNSLFIPLLFEAWRTHEISYIVNQDILEYVSNEKECTLLPSTLSELESPFWIDLSNCNVDKEGALVKIEYNEEDKYINILSYSFTNEKNNLDYDYHGIGFKVDDNATPIVLPYISSNVDDIGTFIIKFVSLIQNQKLCPVKTKAQARQYKPLPKGKKTKEKYSEVDMFDIVQKYGE